MKPVGKQIYSKPWDRTRDQLNYQVSCLVSDQVWIEVRDEVWNQGPAQIGGVLLEQLRRDEKFRPVKHQVREGVKRQTWDDIRGETEQPVLYQIEDQLWMQVRNHVWSRVQNQVLSNIGAQLREETAEHHETS